MHADDFASMLEHSSKLEPKLVDKEIATNMHVQAKRGCRSLGLALSPMLD